MSGPPPKKDHRIQLRVIEGKKFHKQDECDSYVVVKIMNMAETAPDSPPKSRTMSLDRGGLIGPGNNLNESTVDPIKSPTSTYPRKRRGSVRAGVEVDQTRKSKVVYKSRAPWWDEDNEFELAETFREINIDVMIRTMLKDKILGRIVIPRVGLELDNRSHEEWYPIHHAADALAEDETATGDNLGLVRVRYLYTEEIVLPITAYSKLLLCLLDDHFHVLKVLGRLTGEREELAKICVVITDNANVVVKFLNAITGEEINKTQDPNTIFRANSLGSKALDQYLKWIGMPYLKETLKPLIKEITFQSRNCELDPTRMEKGDDPEENFTVLEAYVKWALDTVLGSAKNCPAPLKQVFGHLRNTAVKKFPKDPVVKYTVVTAFIFLRFFNAAVLGPQLFGLISDGEPPSARNSRTLTLVSKALQQVANMTPFDGRKEPYMAKLNDTIEQNFERMKKFIDELCAPVSGTEVEAFNKKRKAKGKSSKGIGRLFSAFKSDKNAPQEPELQIGRYFGAIHRHLMKHMDELTSEANEKELGDVEVVHSILNDMMDIYNKVAEEMPSNRNIDRYDDDNNSMASVDRKNRASMHNRSGSRPTSIVEMTTESSEDPPPPMPQPNVNTMTADM